MTSWQIIKSEEAAYLPPDRNIGMSLRLVDIVTDDDDTYYLYFNLNVTKLDNFKYYYQLKSSIDTDDKMCAELGINRLKRRRRYLESRKKWERLG